jgi:hypothetical protein
MIIFLNAGIRNLKNRDTLVKQKSNNKLKDKPDSIFEKIRFR